MSALPCDHSRKKTMPMTPEPVVPKCLTCSDSAWIVALQKVPLCQRCLPLVLTLMGAQCLEEIAS